MYRRTTYDIPYILYDVPCTMYDVLGIPVSKDPYAPPTMSYARCTVSYVLCPLSHLRSLIRHKEREQGCREASESPEVAHTGWATLNPHRDPHTKPTPEPPEIPRLNREQNPPP